MDNTQDMCKMPGMESMCGGSHGSVVNGGGDAAVSHGTSAMHHAMAMGGFALPEWALLAMAVAFFGGGVFYLYRTFFPEKVRATYGYWDLENEIGHGICMFAMTTMLAPALLPIPSMLWAGILGAGAAWFLARAVFWGRKLSYNIWWWDWAHVGMLLGMALMFAGITGGAISILTGAFWVWFAGYYAYELYHDARSGKALYIGSDVSHLAMGVVMFAMTAWPAVLMPHMVM